MLYQLVQCVPLLRPACLLCGASSLWWGNVVGGGDLVLGALKAPFFSCCVFGCTGLCKGMWGTGRQICDILAPPLPFMAFSSPALFTALQLYSHSCHGADVRSQVPFLRRNLFLPPPLQAVVWGLQPNSSPALAGATEAGLWHLQHLLCPSLCPSSLVVPICPLPMSSCIDLTGVCVLSRGSLLSYIPIYIFKGKKIVFSLCHDSYVSFLSSFS